MRSVDHLQLQPRTSSRYGNTQYLLRPISYCNINTWALDPLSDCIDRPCQSSVSAAVTVAGWSDSSWRRCHVLLSTAVVRDWISLPPLGSPVLDRIFRAKCPTHVSVTRAYTQNTQGRCTRGEGDTTYTSRIRGENSLRFIPQSVFEGYRKRKFQMQNEKKNGSDQQSRKTWKRTNDFSRRSLCQYNMRKKYVGDFYLSGTSIR